MGGNKRQRLARRKFVQGTGGEVSKQEKDEEAKNLVAAASENGSKQEKQKKKKTDSKKRKVDEINEGEGAAAGSEGIKDEADAAGQNGTPKTDETTAVVKKTGSKHPLRIPGMKPGDGCFICKGTDHIAKLCPTKNTRDRKKICLFCRTVGHTLKNCPRSLESQEAKFCYNCGENGHRLAECKRPLKDGGTGFAECFVCKQKGHLSKSCPTNPHGIYPKGGCCKLCQGVTHLAKDCPTKKAGNGLKLRIPTGPADPQLGAGGSGKRTVFKSGDDLEDDFAVDAQKGVGSLTFGSDDEASEHAHPAGRTQKTVTPQKSQTTKVKKEMGKSDSRTAQRTPKIIRFQRS